MIVLQPENTLEVLHYLTQKPLESVFLRGLILRVGVVLGDRSGGFLGVRGPEDDLTGVMLLSPLVVPFVTEDSALGEFADEVGRSRTPIRHIVGRRETVAGLWEALGSRRPEPRLVRERQPVFWVTGDRLKPAPDPAPVRRATADDLDMAVEAGAAMMREEVEEDPLVDRPQEYRRFIRERILRGDEYVWADSDGLCFKCNVSSRTPDAAQIEGVFTPPARRRQGYAARGLTTVCQRLLHEYPTLCLYVNDFNTVGIHLYESLGFERTFDYQSIFLPPPS